MSDYENELTHLLRQVITKRLKIEMRKPATIKIDDYYFGFPTLLDGAETAER